MDYYVFNKWKYLWENINVNHLKTSLIKKATILFVLIERESNKWLFCI